MAVRQPYILLARAVATLAAGRPITAPFATGPRNTEWSETFVVGPDRVNGGEAVLLKTRTRKDGVEREQRADPCFWSLDAMRSHLLELGDGDFAAIEAQLGPPDLAMPIVARIASLSFAEPGETVELAGRTYTMQADMSLALDGDPQWSLDEVVMAVRRTL